LQQNKATAKMPRPKFDTTPIGVNLGPDMVDVARNPSVDDFQAPGENGKASWEHVFEQDPPPFKRSTAPAPTVAPVRKSTETHAADYAPIGVDLGPDVMAEPSLDFQFQSSDVTPWDHIFGDQPNSKTTNSQSKGPPVKKSKASTTKPAPVKAQKMTAKVTKKQTSTVTKKSPKSSAQASAVLNSAAIKSTGSKKVAKISENVGKLFENVDASTPADHRRRKPPPVGQGPNTSVGQATNASEIISIHPSTQTSEQSKVDHRPRSTAMQSPNAENEASKNGNSKHDNSNPTIAGSKRKRERGGRDGIPNPDGSHKSKKNGGNKKHKADKNKVEDLNDPDSPQSLFVFLLGLPPDIKWGQIKTFFSTRMSIDGFYAKSKPGYWRLSFASKESQKKAFALSGESFAGHPIVIKLKRPRQGKRTQPDRSSPDGTGDSTGGENDNTLYQAQSNLVQGETTSGRTIYLGYLHPKVTPFQIQRFFYSHGKIEDVIAVTLPVGRKGKHQGGDACITFGSFLSYEMALRQSGKRLGPLRIKIRKCEPSKAEDSRSSQSPTIRHPALDSEHLQTSFIAKDTNANVLEADGNAPSDSHGMINGAATEKKQDQHIPGHPRGAERCIDNRQEMGLETKDYSKATESGNDVPVPKCGESNVLNKEVEVQSDTSSSEKVPGATSKYPQRPKELRTDPPSKTESGGKGLAEPTGAPDFFQANIKFTTVEKANSAVEIPKDTSSSESLPMATAQCSQYGTPQLDTAAKTGTSKEADEFKTESQCDVVHENGPTASADSVDILETDKVTEGDTAAKTGASKTADEFQTEIQCAVVNENGPTASTDSVGILEEDKVTEGNGITMPTTENSDHDVSSKEAQHIFHHADLMSQKKEDNVVVIDSDEDDNSQIHKHENAQSQTKSSLSERTSPIQSDKVELNRKSLKVQKQDDKPYVGPAPSSSIQPDPVAEVDTESIEATEQVGTQEAKINSFLEDVHGFQSRTEATTETCEEALARNPTHSASEDEVEIIDEPRAGSRRTCNTVDDEVQVVDGPSNTNATREQPIDLTQSEAKAKRFRPLKPKKSQKSQSDNQKARSRSSSTGGEAAKGQKRSQPEKRFVFGTSRESSRKPTSTEKNFNANLSHEDAVREQERLLSGAAARMRTQKKFQVTQNDVYRPSEITFSQPLIDVQSRFPDHWKLTDPFARLGLPKNSTVGLVKSHYRALARFYHPDKSGTDDTAHKFQAIAAAYHNITNA
jgi:hypothetical protein